MNDEMTDSPDDDTEGHRFIPTEERLAVGDTPDTEPAKNGDDNPDDTEGHRIYAKNVGVDFDSESDDSTDSQLGETVAKSGDDDDDDPDDTEGHRLSFHVGVAFD